jgi:predicted metal-binding membrane protein
MQLAARLPTAPWPDARLWRRASPVLGVEVLAALAWIGLAAMAAALPSPAPSGASTASIWLCMPGMGGAGGGGPLAVAVAGLPMWALMSVAMNLPTAVPATRHVAVNSFRRRRRRAVAEFLAVYLALWLAFGLAAMTGLALLPAASPGLLPIAGLALAAAWELSPLKRRALNGCHRSAPLPPRGWRASAGVARFGLINGTACIASCWPAMLLMLTAPAGRLAWCAGLTAMMASEKLSRRPRRAARRVSAVLGVALAAAVVAALLAGV